MSRRKIPTTVYITPEQERELKALHARTKVPVAEYIRQGIDIILNNNRRHIPGQLDMYQDELSIVENNIPSLKKAAAERRR
jgi:hypothetical protein